MDSLNRFLSATYFFHCKIFFFLFRKIGNWTATELRLLSRAILKPEFETILKPELKAILQLRNAFRLGLLQRKRFQVFVR